MSFSTAPFEDPALATLAPWSRRLAGRSEWPRVEELDALLRDRLALPPPVALELQRKKGRPRGVRAQREDVYAIRIHEQRLVPTRERSWHDLLNALVWAAFPRSKRALTARQHAIQSPRLAGSITTLPGARTREEDVLAMLDEGGVVLLAREGDHDAIERARITGDLAGMLAAIEARRLAVRVFGHALMEHVAEGRPDVRGYAVVLGVRGELPHEPEELAALADDRLAEHVADPRALREPDRTSAIPFRPLCR